MRIRAEYFFEQKEKRRLHTVIAVQPEGAVLVQELSQEEQSVGQKLEVVAGLPDIVIDGEFAQCGLPLAAQADAAGIGAIRVIRRIQVDKMDAAAIAICQ